MRAHSNQPCTHLTKHVHALARPHSHLPTAMHASPPSGNGNVAVAIDAGGAAGGGVLVFRLDRNDAWVPATGDISCCGYDVEGAGARTVGAVTLRFDGAPGFEATQYITNATVYTSQVRELACFSSKLHVTPEECECVAIAGYGDGVADTLAIRRSSQCSSPADACADIALHTCEQQHPNITMTVCTPQVYDCVHAMVLFR